MGITVTPGISTGFPLGEDAVGAFGPSTLQWDTVDANAHHVKLDMPAASGTRVPVFSVGIGINDVDLATFNGEGQSAIAVWDTDRDTFVALGFSADDVPKIRMRVGSGGTERLHTLPDVASDTFAMLGATQTLAAKTLTTPTISATGFANANHAHAAANSGGTLTVSALAGSALQTSGESFADNDTSLMTSASIQDKILAYSYSTTTGTVTSVGTTGTVNGLTLSGTVTSSGNLTLGGTLAVNNGDWSGTDLAVGNGGTGASTLLANAILTGNTTSAIQAETDLLFASNVMYPTATAHNVAGKVLTISAGDTTAGTTNNIAGGALTLQGGQGKGSGAGGDIIFQTANAGSSGSSINSLATALTISDDLSSTFYAQTMVLGTNYNGDPTINVAPTNGAAKMSVVLMPHDQSAEEDIAMAVAYNDNSNNYVSFGGSHSSFNSATILRFYTGANATTLTGTERMNIDAAGTVKIPGNIDLDSTGTLLNVGQSGNDWTAATLYHRGDTGTGVQTIWVENTTTTEATGSARVLIATGSGGGDTLVRFLTDGDKEWAIGCDKSDSHTFKLSRHNLLGGNDAIKVTTANAITFDDSTGSDFDYVGDNCGKAALEPFTCCGVVEWHDDVLALRESRLNPEGIQHMAKLGILEIGGDDCDPGWIGINYQKAQHMTWAGMYQNRQRMDAQYDRLDERLARIEAAIGA